MATATAQPGQRKLIFTKTILVLFLIIVCLAVGYSVIAWAYGYRHAQSADGTISAEIIELHGHKFLRLFVEESELNMVAIPERPRVYFETDGKRWNRDGKPIDPNVMDKPRLVTSTDIISLNPESSLLLKISDSTPGDIVIEVPGGYDTSLQEDARERAGYGCGRDRLLSGVSSRWRSGTPLGCFSTVRQPAVSLRSTAGYVPSPLRGGFSACDRLDAQTYDGSHAPRLAKRAIPKG